MATGMYSPKIREDLIPRLYKLGRHLGIPMTRLVNQFIEQALLHFQDAGIFTEIETEEIALEELTAHFRKLISYRKKKTAEVIELLRKIA